MRTQVISVVDSTLMRFAETIRRTSPSRRGDWRVPNEHIPRCRGLRSGLGAFREDREAHRSRPSCRRWRALRRHPQHRHRLRPASFAEHIHVVNGQIVCVRGYYDPRPILGAASVTAESPLAVSPLTPSIERTSSSKLRLLPAAAHVKRYVSQEIADG